MREGLREFHNKWGYSGVKQTAEKVEIWLKSTAARPSGAKALSFY
jgi:hypothetical protein